MPKSKRYQYAFQDPKLAVEKRIDNLLSLMTLEEKINCLGTDPSVPRLGVKGTRHVEGLHGLAMGGPSNWGRRAPIPTTTFPQAIGMAETWDVDIMQQAGALEGYEIRYLYQSRKYNRGALVIRAPNADLGRDPRWGRTEECYGEDPYFNGTMVVALVKGLQGNHKKYWLTASLMKHFLANSNEDTREHSSSDFSERLFREYYSVPFRMGVEEGHSNAYMAAYNAVNGIPCMVHPVLKDVTMKEWGLDGIICTDGGALRLLITAHKYYPDLAQGAAWGIKMGINQFLDRYLEAVTEAVNKYYLTESDIDNALRRSYRVMIRLGLLDPPSMVPYSNIKDTGEPWLTEKHKSFARLVTQKSIVLLKNSKQLLPLDKKAVKSIAVIGPCGDEVYLDWYSGTPPYTVSPLQGIKNKVGKQGSVKFVYDNQNGAAAALAKSADVAIVCVGNHPTGKTAFGIPGSPSDGKEGVDRKSITLEQEELIKEVYAVNPNTVVVLKSSFPFAINWTQQHIPAILHLAHNSQEEGNALADVLFGDYNPGGRLAQTWFRSLEQLPPLMNYDITDGRTYLYFQGDPLYHFGHGLSYTTFEYSHLKTSHKKLGSQGEMKISVDIKNTGTRKGEEVVQMYVKHLDSTVSRPIKELKGFKRVAIKPGESKTVILTLKPSQLVYWDVSRRKFVVEQDKIEIQVGSSSSDIQLSTIIKVVK